MACQRFWLEGYREKPQNCRDVRMIFRRGAEWGSCPCQAKHFVRRWTFYPSRESHMGPRPQSPRSRGLPHRPSQQTDQPLSPQARHHHHPRSELLFQTLGVFAKFERSMIVKRFKAGLNRARAEGKVLMRYFAYTSHRYRRQIEALEQPILLRWRVWLESILTSFSSLSGAGWIRVGKPTSFPRGVELCGDLWTIVRIGLMRRRLFRRR